MKKISYITSLFMLISAPAFSLECSSTAPTCDELGYKQTEAECPGERSVLRCPFDTTKLYCENTTPKDCVLGDVLYDDKKCYEVTPKNKTPIGVVIDTTHRVALAKDLASNEFVGYFNSAAEYNQACSNGSLKWDSSSTAYDYEDMEAHPFVPYAKYNMSNPRLLPQAQVKTNIKLGKNFVTPQPKPVSMCTGDWSLPPMGVFTEMDNITAINKVNKTLNEIGGVSLFDGTITVKAGNRTGTVNVSTLLYHTTTLPGVQDACTSRIWYYKLGNTSPFVQLITDTTSNLQLSITQPANYGALVRCVTTY